MAGSKFAVGDSNTNHQRRVAMPANAGVDHNSRIWHVRCDLCGTDYGAVGTAFYHRKCPGCQGGAASQDL